MTKYSRIKKEGIEAFTPSTNPHDYCNYHGQHKEWWLEGWELAAGAHIQAEKDKENEITWEDPSIDPIAAIRQIQEILDGR